MIINHATQSLTNRTALEELSVKTLPGVGEQTATRLARIGIATVFDLLLHLPIRYQDRTQARRIADLRIGQEVMVEGSIMSATFSHGKRQSLKVALCDNSAGLLILRFFHFSSAQIRQFTCGNPLRCYGEVRQGPYDLEMIHPECDFYPQLHSITPSTTLTPLYPSTYGITQLMWRHLTKQALAVLVSADDLLPEFMLAAQLTKLSLPTLSEALHMLHYPPATIDTTDLINRRHPAFQRIVLEELLAKQLALQQLRHRRKHFTAAALIGNGQLRKQLRAALGFSLTAAQERVINELTGDLVQTHPMMRLLQGDVGSGKTIVAVLAALQAIEAGYQAALMAPTELLAEQHLSHLQRWLNPLGLQPIWLSSRHKGAERRHTLTRIRNEHPAIVVGTHALFQKTVQFAALGLIIIDEQHRFGVQQRLLLRAKGEAQGCIPHQLIMTATPIPRSLAMVAYADLELSVIDELPSGRQPITTVAVPDQRRAEVIERVRAACAQGRQAYWVCTLIEESDILQCQAAEVTAANLIMQLPELRIGVIHGRMKSIEREPVMSAFIAGELDLLVATTVIEVGVDVANASLIIIENPERLGLAQLHQLRGRVGRGHIASFCLLLYHPPLTSAATERLNILRQECSGFQIADADLRLRGAGEVLGTRQAGMTTWRLVDPLRDAPLIPAVRLLTDWIIEQHQELITPLMRRWLNQKEVDRFLTVA